MDKIEIEITEEGYSIKSEMNFNDVVFWLEAIKIDLLKNAFGE